MNLPCLTAKSLKPLLAYVRTAVVLEIDLEHIAGRQVADALIAAYVHGVGHVDDVPNSQVIPAEQFDQGEVAGLGDASAEHAALGVGVGDDGPHLYLVVGARRALVIEAPVAAVAHVIATARGVQPHRTTRCLLSWLAPKAGR